MGAVAPFVPLIAAGLGAAGSMYSQNQQMSAYEGAQDTAYERQQETENRQKAWAAQQQEAQKAWITEQQTKQEESAAKLRAENEALYQKYAYPSETEMTAKKNQMSADLANEKTKRLESLARNASLRGWGAGSGATAAAGGQVESDYLTSLGKMTNDLTQYGSKAQFGFPFAGSSGFTPMSYSTTYMPSSGSTVGNYGGSNSSNPLATALGMLAYTSGKGTGSTDEKTASSLTSDNSSYFSGYDYPSNWSSNNYPSYYG